MKKVILTFLFIFSLILSYGQSRRVTSCNTNSVPVPEDYYQFSYQGTFEAQNVELIFKKVDNVVTAYISFGRKCSPYKVKDHGSYLELESVDSQIKATSIYWQKQVDKLKPICMNIKEKVVTLYYR